MAVMLMRQPRRRHRSLKYCNDGKLEGGPGHVGEYCGKKQEERGPVRFLHPNFPRCQSKYKESAQPLKVWRDKPLPAFLSVLFRALGCFPSTAPKKKKRKRERETTPGRETPLQQTPSGSASEKQQRRRRLRDSDAEEGTFQTTPLPLPLVTSSETRRSAHHAGTYAMGKRSKLLRIAAWAAQRGYETEPTLPEGSRHKPHGCVPPLLGFDVTSCGV